VPDDGLPENVRWSGLATLRRDGFASLTDVRARATPTHMRHRRRDDPAGEIPDAHCFVNADVTDRCVERSRGQDHSGVQRRSM
jgi:hypothetical protein